MFGASLLKIVKFGFDFTPEQLIILVVAMLVAFGVSMVIIKFLMDYIRKHDFKVFGYYRIILGIVVLIIGGGGREHAIAVSMKKSKRVYFINRE